jgi:hypothetical protein
MQFDAMRRSGSCCAGDDRTATPAGPGGGGDGRPGISFQQVVDLMGATQWSGCGARPGAGLAPSVMICNVPPDMVQQPQRTCRPLTIPGYGVGPHGLELGATESIPNITCEYPLAFRLPDSSFNEDPLDAKIWDPPTTSYGGHTDSWLPWGYAPGPKV